MAKLEGIIYKAFDNYIVLRGFAPIGELAKISRRPEAYQRVTDEEHKKDIVKFLQGIQYKYFPDVILACRTNQYAELLASVDKGRDVDSVDAIFVNGLRVLKEKLPYIGYRARHAYLDTYPTTDKEKLVRVDGNHRLEPFSSKLEWWSQFVENIPTDFNSEGEKKIWLINQAKEYKKQIEDKIIPFTIIFSDESNANNFEAGIFHNINFRQLPLREEASMRIISDLETFDVETLGKEYPLTIELINKAKQNYFNGIPLLTPQGEISKDTYRTACLRIVKLLESRKKYVETLIEKYQREVDNLKLSLSEKENCYTNFHNTEIKYPQNKDGEIAHEDKLDEETTSKLRLAADIKEVREDVRYKEEIINNLKNFLNDCNSICKIEKAIHSLRIVYGEFELEEHGNISMLSALVYYKMLDKAKFNSFVDWIKRNGVNHVKTIDDLPIHSSDALIDMFEEIYKAQRNEIFISMQFGDDQSEMIYEKIIQTIEKFKEHYGHIQTKPIRIDRNIAPHAFTISDEILKAIKNCSLIIADLSSGNKNVYHEIGYSMGIAEAERIKPPVILLYKTSSTHRDKTKFNEDNFIGFNLRGFSQLRFSNYDELSTGLMERLKKHFEV